MNKLLREKFSTNGVTIVHQKYYKFSRYSGYYI